METNNVLKNLSNYYTFLDLSLCIIIQLAALNYSTYIISSLHHNLCRLSELVLFASSFPALI